MPPPDIPGFYYDEVKKRYFKVTNGGINASIVKYHNNTVQAKRRRVNQSRDDMKTASSAPLKNLIIQTVKAKYQYSINNIKLGYVAPTYSDIFFKSIRCPLSREVKDLSSSFTVCAKLKGKLLIEDKDMCVGIVSNDCLKSGDIVYESRLENRKIIQLTSAIRTVGINLIGPKIASVSINKNNYFAYIDAKDPISCTCVNFFQLGKYDGRIFKDKSTELIEFVYSLSESKWKTKLSMLLATEMILHDNITYDYDYILSAIEKSNYFITSSFIDDKELILGTNKGEIIRLLFDGDFKFHKINYYNYFKSAVIGINVTGDHTYVASDNQIITLRKRTIENRTTTRQPLKKLIVTSGKYVVLIGLKSVDLLKYVGSEPTFTSLAYHNDNIVSQIATVFHDVLLINESNTSIKVYNLKTLETDIITLEIDPGDELIDIMMISHSSIIFLFYADTEKKSKAMIYNL